jgi:hypothetical protein
MTPRLRISGCLPCEPQCLRGALFFFLSGTLFLASGCADRKRPSVQWQTASVVRPRVPAKPATPPVEDPPPDLAPVIPQPSRLILAHGSPPRPRTVNGAGNGSEGDPRGGAPAMAPQLTPDESAAAQQQTDQSLRAAEANLGRFRGRALTPAQSEMAGKTRDFIRQSHQAASEKDWIRARNLAEKAQLLSEELLRAL